MRAYTLLNYIIVLAAMLPFSSAAAREYTIEVVLFENLFESPAVSAPTLYVPHLREALALDSEQAAQAGFVPIAEPLQLTANADSIREARSYRLLSHFAWRQPGLDEQSARAIHLSTGDRFRVFIPADYRIYPDFIPATLSSSAAGDERQVSSSVLNGTLTVRLGRFLHLDARLVFTDTNTATSYRMNHSRKMRSRELHYIDNPRFGMLVKIVPVPEPEPEPESASEPATQPNQPTEQQTQ